MSEPYRICVVSGIPISAGNVYEAEALVYTFGGRVVARFRKAGNRRYPMSDQAKRDAVQAQAEAWIEANRGR
jgi:hypothetical protein